MFQSLGEEIPKKIWWKKFNENNTVDKVVLLIYLGTIWNLQNIGLLHLLLFQDIMMPIKDLNLWDMRMVSTYLDFLMIGDKIPIIQMLLFSLQELLDMHMICLEKRKL